MGRTIIVSDIHGSMDALNAALSHSNFDASADRLIAAGDMIDVGTDDVVAALEDLGATVLVGNHEIAAALGLRIFPQNEESLARSDEFADKISSGAWKLAAEAEGWLVTHAGVSATLSDLIRHNPDDPSAIAAILNVRFGDEFADAVEHRPLSWADLERYRLIGGQSGPLWFRPTDLSLLPSGLRQVVGHTPPDLVGDEGIRRLESAGWLLVDSGGHDPRSPGTYRYGVLEDGRGRVVDG